MDEKFIKVWFRGFVDGIDQLDESVRTCILKECGKRCADTGVLSFYREQLQKANGDRDVMYQNISAMDEIRAEILVPQKEYYLYYKHCLCDLHTAAGVNSSSICECSRQSIIYILKNLYPDEEISVKKVETVLEGASACKFHICFM